MQNKYYVVALAAWITYLAIERASARALLITIDNANEKEKVKKKKRMKREKR